MSCEHPFHAFPTGRLTEKGKPEYFLSFTRDLTIPAWQVSKSLGVPFYHDLDQFIEVPCGKCYSCRKEYARRWSFRCLFEASEHKENYFVTLTYDDAHLPLGSKLCKKHLQDFFKRLRKHSSFRYLACGEYGESFGRPHYHILCFGLHLENLIKRRGGLLPGYQSCLLDQLWPFGFVDVSPVSSPGAVGNYVAKYCLKVNEDKGKGFLLMSRKPGLGFNSMLEYVKKDNPNPNGWDLLCLGDGRGNSVYGNLPRSLRERLQLSPSDEVARACIIKLQNKMRACGYSSDDCWNFDKIEAFRVNSAEIVKRKEVARNLFKL